MLILAKRGEVLNAHTQALVAMPSFSTFSNTLLYIFAVSDLQPDSPSPKITTTAS